MILNILIGAASWLQHCSQCQGAEDGGGSWGFHVASAETHPVRADFHGFKLDLSPGLLTRRLMHQRQRHRCDACHCHFTEQLLHVNLSKQEGGAFPVYFPTNRPTNLNFFHLSSIQIKINQCSLKFMNKLQKRRTKKRFFQISIQSMSHHYLKVHAHTQPH